MTPLVLVAFPGLLWLDEGSAGLAASFRLGYAFGFGFFLSGLYWIAAALFVDLDRYWWLVPIAAAGLPAVFALYVALALLATHWVVRNLRLPATARVFAFAIAWTVAEWVRGHAFTGLPWNLIGYAWSGGFPAAILMLQSVAWIGIYGLSFLTVLAASLPALFGTPSLAAVSPGRRLAPAIAAGLLILVAGMAGAVRLQTMPIRLDRHLAAARPALDPAEPEVGSHRGRQKLPAPPRPQRRPGDPPDCGDSVARGGRSLSPRTRCSSPARDRRGPRRAGLLITGALSANPPPGPVLQVFNSIEALNAYPVRSSPATTRRISFRSVNTSRCAKSCR